MSLRNVDIESAMRRLADKRIEDAMREGKFDNLEGAGKPLNLEPMPADEGARMMWWAIKILKQNDVTPDEVRWRKAIDHLKQRIHEATSEQRVIELVETGNDLVRKINTMGTNALKSGVAPLDVETEIAEYRRRSS